MLFKWLGIARLKKGFKGYLIKPPCCTNESSGLWMAQSPLASFSLNIKPLLNQRQAKRKRFCLCSSPRPVVEWSDPHVSSRPWLSFLLRQTQRQETQLMGISSCCPVQEDLVQLQPLGTPGKWANGWILPLCRSPDTPALDPPIFLLTLIRE